MLPYFHSILIYMATIPYLPMLIIWVWTYRLQKVSYHSIIDQFSLCVIFVSVHLFLHNSQLWLQWTCYSGTYAVAYYCMSMVTKFTSLNVNIYGCVHMVWSIKLLLTEHEEALSFFHYLISPERTGNWLLNLLWSFPLHKDQALQELNTFTMHTFMKTAID